MYKRALVFVSFFQCAEHVQRMLRVVTAMKRAVKRTCLCISVCVCVRVCVQKGL